MSNKGAFAPASAPMHFSILALILIMMQTKYKLNEMVQKAQPLQPTPDVWFVSLVVVFLFVFLNNFPGTNRETQIGCWILKSHRLFYVGFLVRLKGFVVCGSPQ